MNDDSILFIVGPLIGGLILYVFIGALVRSPGASLNKKFHSLGDMRGRHIAEIVAVVGQPSAQSALPNGKTLYQWMATGYHVALVFDGNICEGISHVSAT